jgi:hypothetical protein
MLRERERGRERERVQFPLAFLGQSVQDKTLYQKMLV